MNVVRAALSLLPVLAVVACGGDTSEDGAASSPSATASTEVTRPVGTSVASPGATGAEDTPRPTLEVEVFDLPAGSGPHDVAPAADGGVWYTAQRAGALGYLDPRTGATRQVKLGAGSAPHGVIVAADGAAWVTDGGLNAIVRVDADTDEVRHFPLPPGRGNVNLNTAAFDGEGMLWFTGQRGVYGRLDPRTGEMEVFDAPRGAGPYGITSTPSGEVYYASLAGNHIARIDTETGFATPIDPPTAGQGARRVWSDSHSRIWVSEYNSGQVSLYDPNDGSWRSWRLPGASPRTYAVYVDDRDGVWLTDFGGNALVRFDVETETFTTIPNPDQPGNVRQLLGRPGELWAPESANDRLFVVRY
ncbi:MAG: lyase [Dehalococcoidia bacterium]